MTPPPSRYQPVEILLVEDNSDDVELTQLAFEQSKVVNNLRVARDGVEALALLRREGPYSEMPRPELVLLDLNLPRMDGRELLAVIKEDHDLRRIPVVILTTSKSDDDILRAYDMHANAYLIKPIQFSDFVNVASQISDHWFTLVQLPPITTPATPDRDPVSSLYRL